ncbi:hypothetical protein P3T76_012514 [Phytophthora citrophthora]|uniref:Uncharacterized protein n=1 Tax=Phytophthora citrophthora TaxID=4793 RepID=A0AAD9G4P9_9STRA|nr:hypothetical protein P3T76_012514 [Phytophthora citrophthora]
MLREREQRTQTSISATYEELHIAMAASSTYTGASAGRHDGSGVPSSFPSTSESSNSAEHTGDDEFGGFEAAERLSDPFGDVYGAEAAFGDFVGGQTQNDGLSVVADNSSMMPFSPLTTSGTTTAPPTLLPSISGEVDPFADITGGLGAGTDTTQATGNAIQTMENFNRDTTPRAEVTAPSSATSAILDLVWGNTSQKTEINPLSMSATSVGSGSSRTASNPSGFKLPPPPSTKFATFPSASTSTPEASTGDLLSFSPVHSSTPSDPFFGITNDTSETSEAAPAFGNDELFTLSATPPLSTTSSSAPISLHGSFASLHEEVKPSILSPSTPGSLEGKQSPSAERTTRSFGSLSSSFVSVGAMEESVIPNGVHASFGAFASTTPEAGTTPSSAPPSLHSSFKMTDGFMGFSSGADEDEVDPFAEAGLAAPEEVPLAEALAAWNTSAEPTAQEENSQEITSHETDVIDANKQDQVQSDKLELAMPDDQCSDNSNEAAEDKAPDDFQGSGAATPASLDNGDAFCQDEQAAPDADSSTMVTETKGLSFVQINESEVISAVEIDENVDTLTAEENGDDVQSSGLDGIFQDDKCELGNDNNPAVSIDEVVWTEGVDPFKSRQPDPFSSSAESPEETSDSIAFGSSSDIARDSVLQPDFVAASPPIPDIASGEVPASSDDFTAIGSTTQNEAVDVDDGDSFGDFGDFEATAAPTTNAAIIPEISPWGSLPAPTPIQNMPIEDEDESFGDFAGNATSPATVEDDGFADFGQSTDPSGDDDFGDFGDFTQTTDDQGFSGFQQSDTQVFGDDGDFGDFTPSTNVEAIPSVLPAASFTKPELSSFFTEAFVTAPVPTSAPEEPDSPTDVDAADSAQESSMEFVQDVFRTMWDEYITIVVATTRQASSSSGSLSSVAEPNENGERVRLGGTTTRASKYLKYVLSEKIQEASRQNGIFPHGSERHQMYVGYAASGDSERMHAALKELQDALFLSSVNDAMMRIAKQAALSAKAKIAEQAAQQQASSRGGSLFSTTRHLLSRGGGATGSHGPASSGSDKADHAGADTPTGASVQKLARFSFTNNHDDSGNGHRGINGGDERGSEGSDHTGHSSGSDSEAVDSRTRSQTLSNSSGNGGLMRKFQDRFSFASSRHRPRLVSLRRKGQSGEEVRKMELNLDAISGGLDEVKWKCAMFLYDVEEVAHVAPSQINILSYPSKQPLTGKTDRSALTKLVKPDTIWTVDIGANNSDMLNEW